MFSDALSSKNFVKTLNAFISKLHFKNGSQDFSVTTWPILFKFTGVKSIESITLKVLITILIIILITLKVLPSKPGELFWKKIVLLFTKNWWKMESKFSKKFQTPAICLKKHLLAHCFDSSKKIISHSLWFKRNVLDNILTTSRGLAENGVRVKILNSKISEWLIFRIRKLTNLQM